jgi:DNA-directed RNA polymerase I and III subunit RPAC2
MPSAQPEEHDQSMVDVDVVDEVPEEEIDEDKEIEIEENRVTVVCLVFFPLLFVFDISANNVVPV